MNRVEELINKKYIEMMNEVEQEELKELLDKAPKIYIDVDKVLNFESENDVIEYFMTGINSHPDIVIVLEKKQKPKEEKTLFQKFEALKKNKKTGVEKLLK